MKKIVFFGSLIVCGFLTACSDPSTATRALDDSNFSDIKITGYRWFGCDKETFHTGFEATNIKGKKVSGVVCSGWFKNSTVRMD